MASSSRYKEYERALAEQYIDTELTEEMIAHYAKDNVQVEDVPEDVEEQEEEESKHVPIQRTSARKKEKK